MSELLDELNQKKKQIEALCHKYGARRIRVFGSVARGEESQNSDIDLLVDFPRGYDLFAQRLPLAESLQKLLGRSIDLIPEHEVNRHMKTHVLQEAIEISVATVLGRSGRVRVFIDEARPTSRRDRCLFPTSKDKPSTWE